MRNRRDIHAGTALVRRIGGPGLLLSLGAMACGGKDLDQDGDGFTELTNDCDDTNPNVHPDAVEICWNDIDDNCNGQLDEVGATSGRVWYADVDGDGYGIEDVTIEACEQPENYAAERWDCDEGNPDVHPGATEVCDGVDNDCDGIADELSAADIGTWYPDADGDGFGDTDQPVVACEAPPGYVATPGDCLDADPLVHPDMDEDCRTAVDDDCDGTENGDNIDPYGCVDFYADADGDGFAGTASCQCAADEFYTDPAPSDCDDTNPDRYPGAASTKLWGPEDCDDTSTIDLLTITNDIPSVGAGFGYHAMGDYNADGAVDLLFTGQVLEILEGPLGPDAVSRPTSGPTDFEHYAHGGFVPDLDGDGNEDILVVPSSFADPELGVYVFSSQAPASGAAPAPLFFEPMSDVVHAFMTATLAVDDLDGDGHAEVFYGSDNRYAAVLVLNDDEDDVEVGRQTHWDTTMLNIEGWGQGNPKLELHDMNGDGIKEVVQASSTSDPNNRTAGAWTALRDGAVGVFEVFEERSFGLQSIILGHTRFARDMAVHDHDGDGYADIFSVDRYSTLGEDTATLVGFQGPLSEAGTYGNWYTSMNPDWKVAIPADAILLDQPGDLDLDGLPDLIVTQTGESQAWHMGALAPGHHAIADVGRKLTGVEYTRLYPLGDADGDGANDVAYTTFRGAYPIDVVLFSGDLP